MAKALESAQQAAARDAPTPRPAWQLTHHGGDTYLLENVGDATAYDVDVQAPPDLPFRARTPLPANELAPQQVIQFMAVRTLGTKDDTMTVVWSDVSGSQRQEWLRPLPPKR